MKNPMLESTRVRCVAAAAAVAFGALALGVGNPAWAGSSVTEEQAEAAAVVADAVADAANDQANADDVAASDDEKIDARFVETVIWSEPEDPPAWFPVMDESEPRTPNGIDLTLAPSPMQTTDLSPEAMAAQEPNVITNEHAVIPLPPAAWTGLAGLASLATIRGRKALIRFFCT